MGGLKEAARPDAARPTRSVQARKRPQTEGDALGGGPTNKDCHGPEIWPKEVVEVVFALSTSKSWDF